MNQAVAVLSRLLLPEKSGMRYTLGSKANTVMMERVTLTLLDSSMQTYKGTWAIGNMIPATRENIPAMRVHSEEGGVKWR